MAYHEAIRQAQKYTKRRAKLHSRSFYTNIISAKQNWLKTYTFIFEKLNRKIHITTLYVSMDREWYFLRHNQHDSRT